MNLSKENVLNVSDNGLDFYKFVISDLKQQGSKCQNIKNPFYDDKKASLSIFLKNGHWLYNDFGNSSFSGDMFDFAAHFYNLSVKTDFIKILENINRDLELDLVENNWINEFTPIQKQLYHIKLTKKDEAIEYEKNRKIKNSNMFYQANAYLNYPTSVIFVNNDETGFERRLIASKEELDKLNLPKTKYEGIKANKLYIEGFDINKDKVFICEGPNNALSFYEIGLSAIATFGASNIPNSDVLRKYVENKHVYLAGDSDQAGDEFDVKLAILIVENNITVKSINAVIFPKNKDANDLLIENNLVELENYIQSFNLEAINEHIKIKQNEKIQDVNFVQNIDSDQIQQSNFLNNNLENTIFNTPTLNADIYENLPGILKDSCELFKDKIDKDVFLIGSIGVLSACLPNIKGIYFNKTYSPHLFVFITAPAGSGKGNMEWSKYFGLKIHDTILENTKKEKAKFQTELDNFNNLTKKEKNELQKPEQPPNQIFFIPANSSTSAFLQTLSDNNFTGIIFETEADTLANTFKQEWGNFSDILRKAFHHETTSMNRRKDNEYIEIKNPHLAIVLSGTPNQVSNLMPDIENGLFSRFLFYAFEDNSDFKNPFISHNNSDFVSFFDAKSQDILELYSILEKNNKLIFFKFTDEQANIFTENFQNMLVQSKLLLGNDFNANIKRLGVITFRIAMIFSTLRIIDTAEIVDNLICNDTDFNNALKIAISLEKHAVAVYNNFPKNNFKDKKLKFYDSLPNQFDRKTYLRIAQDLDIHEKAAEKYIHQFKISCLLNHDYNQYSKIKI